MQEIHSVPLGDPGYAAGSCNIGRDEIRARRSAGHLALTVTVVLAVALLLVDAPRLARLVVFIPAAGAASGYLQAAFHFCAGFGMRGVYNFGRVGTTENVVDVEAQRRDRRRSLQIFGLSVLVGAVVAGTFTII